MKRIQAALDNMRKRIWHGQRGITGLETAIVLIAFVVVAAVFAFAVITTGLFSSEKAADTAISGLGEASTSLTPRGAVIAQASPGDDAVSAVRFKMTNGGSEPVGLAPASTLFTYTDSNQVVTLVRAADATGAAETAPWWYSDWKLGTGDSLDTGEVVEITVGLLTTSDSTADVAVVVAAGDGTVTVGVGEVAAAGLVITDQIYIDKERMTITGIAGDVLTVTRGVNGTTDAAHALTADVFKVRNQLTTNLGVNLAFKVEIVPAEGAVFTMNRTSPIELTAIMDLQ